MNGFSVLLTEMRLPSAKQRRFNCDHRLGVCKDWRMGRPLLEELDGCPLDFVSMVLTDLGHKSLTEGHVYYR